MTCADGPAGWHENRAAATYAQTMRLAGQDGQGDASVDHGDGDGDAVFEAAVADLTAGRDAQRATAEGEADANRARAASLREGNQELIAASKLIDALPALVEAAARGIADSNLTILNGTQGVNEVVAGLIGQGMSILDLLKKSSANGNGAGPTPVTDGRSAADLN